MKKVSSIKYLHNYSLQILFNDGKTKIVDFDSLIDKGGYYFGPLKDVKLFKKVSLDEFNYTICWPNGADLSPDILYEIGKEPVVQTKKHTSRHTPKRHKKITATKSSLAS